MTPEEEKDLIIFAGNTNTALKEAYKTLALLVEQIEDLKFRVRALEGVKQNDNNITK